MHDPDFPHSCWIPRITQTEELPEHGMDIIHGNSWFNETAWNRIAPVKDMGTAVHWRSQCQWGSSLSPVPNKPCQQIVQPPTRPDSRGEKKASETSIKRYQPHFSLSGSINLICLISEYQFHSQCLAWPWELAVAPKVHVVCGRNCRCWCSGEVKSYYFCSHLHKVNSNYFLLSSGQGTS